MNYVILDKTVYINGVSCGTFVNVLQVKDGIANVILGNAFHSFNVIVVDNNVQQSVKDFFDTFTEDKITN